MEITGANTARFRYPGTKFFEADQNDIFFGRKEETASLVHSIKAHDIFVIFADSGIGKTSLLNAGIIPELEGQNELERILPVKFRFQDTGTSPLQIIEKKLIEYTSSTGVTEGPHKDSLWQLFKRCHFKNATDATDKIPLLIFDQFEEFFNHKKPDREACIQELAHLTNQYLPDHIREEMADKFRNRPPTPEEIKYYTAPRLKMLFLIRADKLKLLDDFSKKIPVILRNRFHLKPLNKMQAEQAILFPACLPRNGFASPAFSFEDEAVTQICNYLKNDEEEVESFQLQILCQELEKRVIERYTAANTPEAVLITEKELGGEAGMNDITKNYYTNKINAIADNGMRQKAVELIEDKLIVEDRRISQAEFLLLKEGYSRELLDYLLGKTRLIRIDNDAYIEISHDRLLPSILNLKQKRKEDQEKAAVIQHMQEEEQKHKLQLQHQQEEDIKKLQLTYLEDKVKKAAKLRVYIVVLILLLIAVFWTSINADRAKTLSNITMANYYISLQDYYNAKKAIANKTFFSLFNFSFHKTLQDLHDSIALLDRKKDQFNGLISQADSLTDIALTKIAIVDALLKEQKDIDAVPSVGGDDLIKARKLYDSAYSTGFGINNIVGPEIETSINILQDSAAKVFKQTIEVAEKLMLQNKRQNAVLVCNKAQNMLLFANDFSISLAKEDTIHLYNLLHTLNNEKKSFLYK